MPSLSCWPYHDVKEKNEFKKVVQTCISHLVECNYLSPTFLKAGVIMNASKGSDVWALLRAMTDVALRQAISHFYDSSGSPTTEESCTRNDAGCASSEEKASEEKRHSNLSRVSLHSLIDLDTDTHNELLKKVNQELFQIHEIVDNYTKNQANQKAYLTELESRLKRALKNTESLEKNMKKLLSDSTAKILSDNGRSDRSAIVDKLNRSILQLQSLSESTLFLKTQELLKKESTKNAAAVSKMRVELMQ